MVYMTLIVHYCHFSSLQNKTLVLKERKKTLLFIDRMSTAQIQKFILFLLNGIRIRPLDVNIHSDHINYITILKSERKKYAQS